MSEPLVWPEKMTPALEKVLGRPNFTCAELAEVLRHDGVEIPRKAEAEQAAVIFWLVPFVLRHGDGWSKHAKEALDKMLPEEARI